MRKFVLGGVVAAAMLSGGSALATDMMMSTPDVGMACMERTLWSDETCACVADRAADRLNEGQTALLLSFGDGEANYFSTASDYDLSLLERWEVRRFARNAGPICALTS